jgi:hypothetical protein
MLQPKDEPKPKKPRKKVEPSTSAPAKRSKKAAAKK